MRIGAVHMRVFFPELSLTGYELGTVSVQLIKDRARLSFGGSGWLYDKRQHTRIGFN